jgi:hypothetical protein
MLRTFAAGSDHLNAKLIAHRCAGLLFSFLQLMISKCCFWLFAMDDVMCTGSPDTLVVLLMQEVLV